MIGSKTLRQVGTVTVLAGDGLTLHSFMAPEEGGEMTCSQVVETAGRLVVVDALHLRPHARHLRQYVDGLGKPIDRVIVSHSHPDHWLGLEYFKDVPIHALAETKEEISKAGPFVIKFKKPQYGDQVADEAVIPTVTVEEGRERIDGVEFVFRKITDAESPVMLIVELPEHKVLIAQDLVYNRVYPCVGEKNAAGTYLFDGWVRALEDLEKGDYEVVLPGHGEPTDKSSFATVRAYVREAQRLFEAGAGEEELKRRMAAAYPGYRVPEMLDLSNLFLFHRDW
ncbi:MAG TPA: MBL fold metallo-hydrolase [Candidatus Dormibacteraeota bacterium]